MTGVSRLARSAAALKRRHEKFESWSRKRPSRTTRLFASAGVLFTVYGLTEAKNWHDSVYGASVLVLLTFVVVAPRGLYDGRATPWAGGHQVLSWVLTALFMGAAGFLAVSAFVSDWKFGLFILIPVAAMSVVRMIADRRKLSTDDGSPSGVDDDPSVGY